MKRQLAFLISAMMLFTLTTPVFAAETTSCDNLSEAADAHATISNNIIEYAPFTVKDQEVRLFPETTLTATDAIEKYSNAYTLVSSSAETLGISTSLDNADFQEYAKTFAFYESGTAELNQEVQDFAKFMDIYENAAKNEQILQVLAAPNTFAAEEVSLETLMPISGNSTVAAGEVTEPASPEPRATSYNTKAVVTYASNWWNKTNNTDYPYYGEYNKQDTSSNKYNSLDTNRPGQSNPVRAWNDCTNYVSQCLAAGGVPSIKKGVLFPHRSSENWYYSNDKPSHTWGGAQNFYEHWRNRAGVAASSQSLGVGDAISLDLNQDGDIDHTVIIVEGGSGDSSKLLSAHTTDRYKTKYSNGSETNWSVKSLYDSNFKVYGYEIDKIF